LIKFSPLTKGSQAIVVSLDGRDAELFRMLVRKLGSEKRAQDAIILQGYLTKLSQSGQVSAIDVERVERLWPKVIGVSKKQFDAMLEEA
jgi:hypothetical protein